MSLAGSTPAPSAPARAGGFDQPFDGVRGVTAAREPVELEATGSTPAGHPQCDRGDGGEMTRNVRELASDEPRRPGISTAQVGAIFRGVLLGEQRASKTRGQGSNPCAPAPADVAER